MNIEEFLVSIENLTVSELVGFIGILEKRWGVLAMQLTTQVTMKETEVIPIEEEQTTFDVILKESGPNKIPAIKIVRQLCGLGLVEAKNTVEAAPITIKQGISKEEAEAIKARLVEIGAVVEIQ